MYKSFIGVMMLAMAFIVMSGGPVFAQDATSTATTTEDTATTTDDTSTTTDDSNTDDDDSTTDDTSSVDSGALSGLLAKLELLKSLMAQLTSLQTKLKELTGQVQDVRAELRTDLREGLSGDDVERLQELLASDPSLYPEGLTTGFFGPLTREAVKRFQVRHELQVTGTIDEDTKALLEEYFADLGKEIPPGFLRAPGIQKKIEMRYVEGCEKKGRGNGAFCNKIKVKYEMKDRDDDDDDEMDDDSDDSSMSDDDNDDDEDMDDDDSDDDSNDDDSDDSDDNDDDEEDDN